MTRPQQRTSQARTQVRRALPPLIPDAQWIALSHAARVTTVRVIDPPAGVSITGIPGWRILGQPVTLTDWVWAEPDWVLTWSEDLPSGSTLVLPQQDPGWRTPAGGYLLAGQATLGATAPENPINPMLIDIARLSLNPLTHPSRMVVDPDVSGWTTDQPGCAVLSWSIQGAALLMELTSQPTLPLLLSHTTRFEDNIDLAGARIPFGSWVIA